MTAAFRLLLCPGKGNIVNPDSTAERASYTLTDSQDSKDKSQSLGPVKGADIGKPF